MTVGLLCLWLTHGVSVATADTVAIVVHPDVPAEQLSRTEAKRIFSQQRRKWNEDETVTVVLPPPESPSMQWLSEEVLGVRPAVFRRYLLESAYRRGHAPPIEAVSEADALSKTAGTQGAVTAVPDRFVDETVRPVALVD